MHPLVREEKVEIDNINSNYKKDSEIQEELKNVNIENHLEFDYHGRFEFRKCEYCDGLLLGHLTQKCPKLDYDEKVIKKSENNLKNL